MQITLDNRDTENVHIDTYGMLTGDSADEMQMENFREDGQSDDYDDYDWSYDHPAIVRDFAHVSINYLYNELVTHGNGIVESIQYVSHGSPKFYNYTTDYYVAIYTVNPVKLHEYIAQNYDAVLEKAQGYRGDDLSENIAHAGLCHYIDATIDRDDYNMHMWESEHEVYYENTTVTLAE